MNNKTELINEMFNMLIDRLKAELNKSSSSTDQKIKEKLTKDEIKQRLKERGIKFRVRDSHQTLTNLLNGN